jgi:deoxyribodipyrimidine photo-lyase
MSISSYTKMPSNDSADAPSRKRPHSPSDTSDKRTKAKPQPDTAQTQGNNILIWFRSDLRTRDNPALEHALKLAEERKPPSIVFAVYIVSPSEFHSHDVGAVKVDFILRNLSSLSSRLWNPHRIPLLLKTSTTGANVIQDLKNLCQDLSITHVFANKEFEVDESRRDSKCFDLFAKQGISFHLFQDQCVVPPGQLKSKSANSIYTVYSPFNRRWLDVVKNEKNKYLTLAKALTDFKAPINSEDSLKSVEIQGPDAVPSSLKGFELEQVKRFDLSQFWPAGEDTALRNLATFCRGVSTGTAVPAAITKYDSNRNIPNLETGTSRLSPYLAAGVLSTKQCVLEAMESNGGKLDTGSSGAH